MMEAALNYPDHSHPVDTRKASLIAGVAEKTLENLRHIGGGPRYIKLGRKVMYDPRDIEAWKEARKIASTSERSEEHTSELQSLMRISYAVFCLKKKNNRKTVNNTSDE